MTQEITSIIYNHCSKLTKKGYRVTPFLLVVLFLKLKFIQLLSELFPQNVVRWAFPKENGIRSKNYQGLGLGVQKLRLIRAF